MTGVKSTHYNLSGVTSDPSGASSAGRDLYGLGEPVCGDARIFNHRRLRLNDLEEQRRRLSDEAVLSLLAIMATLREERATLDRYWHDIMSERMGSLKVAIRIAEQLGDD